VPDDRAARAAYQDAKADVVAALEAEALARRSRAPASARRGTRRQPRRRARPLGGPGGWALDLLAGAPSRHHDDVDVAVDAADDRPCSTR
jgi:hypothetical protein